MRRVRCAHDVHLLKTLLDSQVIQDLCEFRLGDHALCVKVRLVAPAYDS